MEILRLSLWAKDVVKHFRGAPPGAGLNGFSLEVSRGTVCALIGPNGAGKTTAVRVLSTLLRADGGQAAIDGFDLATQAAKVRERIGLVGQQAAVDDVLDGKQNLVFSGRLRHLSPKEASRRADELLERFSLKEAGKLPAGKYSGGMRRRLDLAMSLISVPSVLFVDEPTTGLDPGGRKEVWDALRESAGSGTTILLTTQYLEEADVLADRIAFLKEGRVIAEGSPADLKALVGGNWIDVTTAETESAKALEGVAARVAIGPLVRRGQGRLSVPVSGGTRALIDFAAALDEADIAPLDLILRRATLDEVFLHLASAQNMEVPA